MALVAHISLLYGVFVAIFNQYRLIHQGITPFPPHKLSYEEELSSPEPVRRAQDANENLVIYLDNQNQADTMNVLEKSGMFVQIPVYRGDLTPLSGYVKVRPKKNKSLKYVSVRIELIGTVEYYPFKDAASTFLSQTQSIVLDKAGECEDECEFNFPTFPKKYETYIGTKVRVRYFVKATMFEGSYQIAQTKQEIGVQRSQALNRDLLYQIQVGVPDAIDLLLELNKADYYLDETIIGKVTFNMAKVDLKRVELIFSKRETYFIDNTEKFEEETLNRTEIKQGHPKKGEMIPFKVNLSHLNLGQTVSKQEENFSINYYLKISLCNKLGPAFFRKVEIKICRKENTA